jgi:O-antigen/teichoic acid export membrane protein
MTRVCALLAVLVLGIFALCSSALSRFLHVDFWALALTVIAIAFAIIVPATRGVLQGVQDYRSFAVATMVECFVRLGCGVGFAAHGFGAAGAMAGFAIGSAASWLYASLTIRKHITTNDNTMNLTIDFKRLAMTSRGVTLSTIALTILGFVDVVFVKHYLTAREAGLYGVLSLAGKIIIFSVSFIPTLLLPKAVQTITRGGDARGILIKAILATTGLSAVSLAVFFALPSLIVRVMAGSDFLAAAPYIFSYGVATSLLAATTLAATYNIGIHRFAFIPRLLAVCALEVAGICWQHHSMAEIVRIVVFANAAGLLAAIVPPARKPSQNG